MKLKRIIIHLLAATMLICSMSAFSVNSQAENSKSLCTGNYAPSSHCKEDNETRSDTRALLDGCDTCVQINTSARLSTLVNNGSYAISFIGRYLQNASSSNPKKITPTELKLLSSASIAIVSLYQLSGSSASCFDYQKGVTQATDAISCATALGQPSGKPIYFCVDFWPANNSEYQCVLNYFSWVYSVLSSNASNPKGYTMGAYGCSTVLKKLRASYASIKTMLCGTTNCYDGTYFTSWNIKQDAPQVLIGSGSNSMNIDVDHGYSSSYGAWQHVHAYPITWQNFGSPAEHRHKCIYCDEYEYQYHVQNPQGTGCSVCGYSGVIIYPRMNGCTSELGAEKRSGYIN